MRERERERGEDVNYEVSDTTSAAILQFTIEDKQCIS